MGKKKQDKGGKEDVHVDLGLSGILQGLGNLLDIAAGLAEKGQELKKSGEIRFGGLDRIKGAKDLKGVYGLSVRTLADGRSSVQSFGNIKKTPEGPVVEPVREPMADVFDTPGEIQVVAEMPGIEAEEVRVDLEGDILTIGAEGKVRRYHKEVLLPRAVATENMAWSYRNGILEVRCQTPGE